MTFKDWHLAAAEDAGLMDTERGLNSRVAHYLNNSTNNTIDSDEFAAACRACNVDPDSITENDLNEIQSILNKL